MDTTNIQQYINEIRGFNRFYTRKIGVLDERMLQTSYSLTEGRIIYELGHNGKTTATHLSHELGLDPGYLSRTLRLLQERNIISKQSSERDGRRQVLTLTPEGQKAYKMLDSTSGKEIGDMIADLTPEEQQKLVTSMKSVEALLDTEAEPGGVSYILRPHQPGDIGWVVERHAILYNQAFGWNQEFEALCSEIAAHFLRNYDPNKERCWIAEQEGKRVGSVFLVKNTESTAQLRLLLVEPTARGIGIGKRLVHECTRFAKQCGYSKIMLVTVSILETAHHIYRQEGYQLIKEEPYTRFGFQLVEQRWELDL